MEHILAALFLTLYISLVSYVTFIANKFIRKQVKKYRKAKADREIDKIVSKAQQVF